MPFRAAPLLYFLLLCIPASHSVVTNSLDTFLVSETNSSIRPGSVAHCECRCCRHTSHMRQQCDEQVNIVPLTASFSCDARMSSRRDQFVCGVAMCQAHFPNQCLPPSFINHACVSDRGFIRDWAPLFFVCIMLAVLAYVFRNKAAAGPQVDADHLAHLHETYKRSALPSPSAMVLQPLSSAPQRSYDGSDRPFEIVDVGPRSPGLNSRRATSPHFSMLPGPWNDSLSPPRPAALTATQRQAQSAPNLHVPSDNRDAVT
eukprot:GFKZ01014403.1.p1 GENE.GFKZ01014403.1~~GFKZ01014403.1.p1  ORF type:complete len:259 (+),score=6.21 GFKZ01014403.1:129-905(+)